MISCGFPALDAALGGGLREAKDYLVYGPVGTGKTTFALQFANEGLSRGECAVWVTRRPPAAVFRQAQAFGFDLESHARAGRLVIFEYPEDVLENATRVRDEVRMVHEFRELLAGRTVHRIVFDPVTPLFAGPTLSASAFRSRTVMQAMAEFQATCLYLVDTPEGDPYLGGCMDFAYGVMHFDNGAYPGERRLTFERYGDPGAGAVVLFDVVAGQGLAAGSPEPPAAREQRAEWAPASQAAGLNRFIVSPLEKMVRRNGSSEGHAGDCKILIVDPDAAQRASVRTLLESRYTIREATGAADALALVGAESPDLVILALETRGVDGIEIARKLRQNGRAVPVILLGNNIRRARDCARCLAAGADICLERPFDGRVLKLHVQNLLRRGTATWPKAQVSDALELRRDDVVCTTDLDYFCDRILAELPFARANALDMVVATFYLPQAETSREELAAVTTFLTRSYDLTYLGERGVAVLLAETGQVEPFLRRFSERWQGGPTPAIAWRRSNGSEDFVDVARQLIAETVGISRAAAAQEVVAQ